MARQYLMTITDDAGEKKPLAIESRSGDTPDAIFTSRITLDQLGPAVVNSDGTLGLIANWQKMTPAEQERTLRVLGKRNQLRTKKLQDEAEQQNSDH